MAKVKFDNLKGGRSIAWTGTDAAQSFVAGSFVDVLRGKGGNDTLTGAASKDWFVFEATLSENGVDVITDLQVMGRPKEHDVLDLTKVLGKEVIRRNVDQFVRVAGDQLLVRPSGSGSWETWATLTGVKEGDRIKIRTPRFYDGIQAGPSEGDNSAPVFDPSANYVFEYDENQLIGAVVGTVGGASDAGGGVTQYRFAAAPSSGARLVVKDSNSVSSDGYFEIDNTGKITMTEVGWAATVNDYDDSNTTFDYFIEAGDAAGNWSASQKITLNLKDIGQGTSEKSFYLTLDRTGVWLDTDKDGKRDQGETAISLTATGDLWRVDGVNMEADDVTLRVVDFKVDTALDLKGFGTGDKLIIDYNTNKSSWYNHEVTAWWNPSEKPVFDAALYIRNFDSQQLYSKTRLYQGTALFSGARYTYKPGAGGIIDYSQSAGHFFKESKLAGRFRHYFGARPYSIYNTTKVTKLIPNWDVLRQNDTDGDKFGTISSRFSDSLVKGLGTGHSVEVIEPRFPTTISIGRNGAWNDKNANGVQDSGETAYATTDQSGYKKLTGVNLSAGIFDVRVVDLYIPEKYDLTGFDSDDKLLFDAVTNRSDWYNINQWRSQEGDIFAPTGVPAPTAYQSGYITRKIGKDEAADRFRLSYPAFNYTKEEAYIIGNKRHSLSYRLNGTKLSASFNRFYVKTPSLLIAELPNTTGYRYAGTTKTLLKGIPGGTQIESILPPVV